MHMYKHKHKHTHTNTHILTHTHIHIKCGKARVLHGTRWCYRLLHPISFFWIQIMGPGKKIPTRINGVESQRNPVNAC